MAEGFSAGTVYVDVVPRSNPAANQQVGQQIGRDIQNAMGVGAGGGGGMGGGGGISGGGGGGTSSNVPVGVVSAKMAAAAAEARIQGVMQGNPYSGLQHYASEVALQSSWASRNMPKSAFDYRMQARSTDADRRLMEIDSRVSTFGRDPNAHVNAYRADYGADEAEMRGQLRRDGRIDRQVARARAGAWGPSASFQSAFEDLGRGVPPPVPERTGIGWKNAFMDPIGGRGGSGLFIHAAFGAAEIGHAYGASLAAQSPLNNRTSLQSMRSAKAAVDTVSGGLYGGILSAALRLRENSPGFEAVLGAMSPIGAIADYVAGPQAFNRMDAAIAGAEEGQLNAAAGGDRMLASSASRNDRAGIRDQRIISRLGNRFERGIATNDAAYDATVRQFNQGRAERRNAVAQADGPDAQRRATLELNRYVKDETQTVAESRRKRDADNDALRRDMTRDVRVAGLPTSSLVSAAKGFFGVSGEQAFTAGLKRDEIEAAQSSGPLGYAVAAINRLKVAGRNTMNSYDTEKIRSGAKVDRFLTNFDDLGAIEERRKQAGRDATAWYRTPDQRAAMLDAAESEASRGRMSVFERSGARMQSLLNRNANLSVSAYDSSPYGNTRGDIAEIVTGARAAANQMRREEGDDAANLVTKNAGLELRKMGMEIARGFRAVGVSDPTTIDAYFSGTSAPATGNKSDPTKILEDILRAIKDLGVQ